MFTPFLILLLISIVVGRTSFLLYKMRMKRHRLRNVESIVSINPRSGRRVVPYRVPDRVARMCWLVAQNRVKVHQRIHRVYELYGMDNMHDINTFGVMHMKDMDLIENARSKIMMNKFLRLYMKVSKQVMNYTHTMITYIVTSINLQTHTLRLFTMKFIRSTGGVNDNEANHVEPKQD